MRRLLVAAAFAVSTLVATSAFADEPCLPVDNGPDSLNCPTRTDITNADLVRIAAMSEALWALGGSFSASVLDISDDDCTITGGCSAAYFNYLQKISVLASELATQVKALSTQPIPTYPAKIAALRASHLNKIARLQYDLRKQMPVPYLGSVRADQECQDFYSVYYILLFRMVDLTTRPAGLGAGAGADD